MQIVQSSKCGHGLLVPQSGGDRGSQGGPRSSVHARSARPILLDRRRDVEAFDDCRRSGLIPLCTPGISPRSSSRRPRHRHHLRLHPLTLRTTNCCRIWLRPNDHHYVDRNVFQRRPQRACIAPFVWRPFTLLHCNSTYPRRSEHQPPLHGSSRRDRRLPGWLFRP